MATRLGCLLLLASLGLSKAITWMPNGDWEYYISVEDDKSASSWQEGEMACIMHSGHLASVLTTSERDAITRMLGTQHTVKFWIGLNKLDREKWKFSDKNDIQDNMWEAGYPKNDEVSGSDNLHLCAYMEPNTIGNWKNRHCGDRQAYICKRKANVKPGTPTTPAFTAPAPGYCPSGYFGSSKGNKCYKVVYSNATVGLTWKEALAECRKGPGKNPDLAAINNAYESALLTSAIQKKTFGLWIGLERKATEDSWRWTDNSEYLYQNWGPGEPIGQQEHCTEVWMVPGPSGTWNNIGCTSKRGHICQTFKDRNNEIPTPNPTTPPNCPKDFTPYWYGCYKLEKTPETWEDAQNNCKDQGATLLTVHAEAENEAMRYTLLDQRPVLRTIWLGLYDPEENGQWVWVDHWWIFYMNWGRGEPAERDYCSRMNDFGTWHTTNCTAKHPYICKISNVPPMTTPKPLEGICPDETSDGKTDWWKHGGHCYFFSNSKSNTWTNANLECLKMSPLATLASIHSPQENDWLMTQVGEGGNWAQGFWIGMHRSKTTREFRWVDGSPAQFVHWAPGEPNGERAGEDCVEVYRTYFPGRWNDHVCSQSRPYVCKVIKVPAPTDPPQGPGWCPEGWAPRASSCYYFGSSAIVQWDDARQRCEQQSDGRGTLTSVLDNHEKRFIREQMKNRTHLPVANNYWIGLTKDKKADSKDESYYWIDGSDRGKYKSWAIGNPNSQDGSENCAEADFNNGNWEDQECKTYKTYVCKMRKLGAGDDNDGLSGGQIAGIVIGCIAGVIAISLVIIFLLVRCDVIHKETPEQDTTDAVMSFANALYDRMTHTAPTTRMQEEPKTPTPTNADAPSPFGEADA